MTEAKMEWNEVTQKWLVPVLQEDGWDDTTSQRNDEVLRHIQHADTATVLRIIAFCWWKRNTALGLLSRCDLVDVIVAWKTYIRMRFQGLQLAAQRWKNHAMITNVSDEEMHLYD